MEITPQPKEIEVNNYPLPEVSNIVSSPDGSLMNNRTFSSPNFAHGVSGWKLNSDGTTEINAISASVPALNINQINVTTTNFKKILTEGTTGITIWISNETTPNGNLTGVKGDICLNSSATGQIAYCTAAGTTWTLL